MYNQEFNDALSVKYRVPHFVLNKKCLLLNKCYSFGCLRDIF